MDRAQRGLCDLTEPNIFPSGPFSLSQQGFYHMINLFFLTCTSSFVRSVDFLSVLSK